MTCLGYRPMEFVELAKEAQAPTPEASSEAPCSNAQPWPLRDVVSKLVEAADVLLDQHNYDGHGWELIQIARAEAQKWLEQ